MYYWHWLKNISRLPKTTGYPTERDDLVARMADLGALDILRRERDHLPRRAIALRHVDGGSCNGCESELSMLPGPDYDFSRFGFSFTPAPKHADLLVITGVITRAMVPVIQEVYEQMTAPKRVVALGSCAIDGWVFGKAPDIQGHLDGLVPVTLEIAGCPPTPGDILRGLLTATDGVDPLERSR